MNDTWERSLKHKNVITYKNHLLNSLHSVHIIKTNKIKLRMRYKRLEVSYDTHSTKISECRTSGSCRVNSLYEVRDNYSISLHALVPNIFRDASDATHLEKEQ
jgi:hypothetical protein